MKEAMKLALEALEDTVDHTQIGAGPNKKAITALREALAEQPAQQQEPVVWLIWLHGPAGLFDHRQFAELEFERRNKEYPDPDRKLLPLYTSPQSKPWVGLTEEELQPLLSQNRFAVFALARAIEAKLREKNA